jgi:hypothetical protein
MRSLRVPAAAGVLLCLLFVGGVATASAANPNVIHGCVAKNGAVSVTDTTCPKGTVPLDWSQTGPAGPTGPQGPVGAAGAAGVSGYEVVNATQRVEDWSHPDVVVWVECPAGKHALGGGGVAPPSGNDVTTWVLTYDIPLGAGAVGWLVQAHRFGPAQDGYITSVVVWAICANVQ